jgi:hypothetical protein
VRARADVEDGGLLEPGDEEVGSTPWKRSKRCPLSTVYRDVETADAVTPKPAATFASLVRNERRKKQGMAAPCATAPRLPRDMSARSHLSAKENSS